MSLSIVIVNWNSKELLRKCLLSLRATCAELRPQVIVVDGGSFDGCDQMIAADFPEVEFVQSESNIGFGRSNNLGAERVTGDALLLLNPDTEVQPGAIQTLLAELNRLPRPGIFGARLENPDGSIQPTSVHVLPTPLVEPFRSDLLSRLLPDSRLGGHAIRLRSTETVAVEAVSGACMMMHRSTFQKVDGFNPQYFMYAEDMDLCFKVHHLGLQNFFVPGARIVHHEGISSESQPRTFATAMMRQAIFQYIRMNHGVAPAYFHRFIVCLASVVRIIGLQLSGLIAHRARKNSDRAVYRAWTVIRWSLGLIPRKRGDSSRENAFDNVSHRLLEPKATASAVRIPRHDNSF